MRRVSLGETQGKRVALSKAFLSRVFVARDGKGRWERQQTSGTFGKLASEGSVLVRN